MFSFFRKKQVLKEQKNNQFSFPLSPGTLHALSPRNIRDLLAVSIWCDDSPFSTIAEIYTNVLTKGMSENSDIEKNDIPQAIDFVTHLNKGKLNGNPLRNWNEALLGIMGKVYWVVCWRPLTHDEAASIPALGTTFSVDSGLGMMATVPGDVVLLRVAPTIHCGIIPQFSPIEQRFDLVYAEQQLKAHGWSREVI